MAINLDKIQNIEHSKFSLFRELKDFVIIFTVIFSFWRLFINAQLFVIAFDNIFKTSVVANDLMMVSPTKSIRIKQVEKNVSHKYVNSNMSDNMEALKRKLLEKELEKKLNWIKHSVRTDLIYKPSYSSLMKSKLDNYAIKFNTLPPDSRLYIPKIWVNVHIVVPTNIPIESIEKADYDQYLYSWVVKYPYTSEPWLTWNVFIFWHTSYYWWKHNPYWTIFSSIPRLSHGDDIIITWNWKNYVYKVIKKFIVWPYQVDDVYRKYKNWQYLTIMWCYPIWSDRQRMLIIAKR